MFTRQLKFIGNIGTIDPEVEILINNQPVYTGIVGAGLEACSLGNQPGHSGELITVSWDGQAHEDEIVSIVVNVTKGEVRIGPILVDRLNNLGGTLPDGEELVFFHRVSSDTTGDGRTNILINNTEPTVGPAADTKAWNSWFFSVTAPSVFSCDFTILLREPILY